MGDWFMRQFNFRESTGSYAAMMKTRDEFELSGTTLTSRQRPERQFEAGRFYTRSLRQFRSNTERSRAKLRPFHGRLSVEEVFGDVSVLHTAPENEFAFFQAASQFNCLEFTSPSGTPEKGITIYAHDWTQGPACATACGPGSVVRNYFGMEGDPQTKEKQIENLKEIDEYLQNDNSKFFTVKAGYTLSTIPKLDMLGEVLKDPAVVEDVMERLSIGVQEDTEVTATDFGSNVFELPEGKRHLVTQAYCSACSVSYSRLSKQNWMPFATLVLRASYEATMHAALENALRHPSEPGARRVFLTALGGGAFGNPMTWIECAMREAFKRFIDYGLQIFIVTYGSMSTPEFQRLEKEFPSESNSDHS
eukprot:TRINITY_DN3580_c0_g1_i3.p1 TRINITY_DN3580_c0_g1~~TRINITY_DN3580_c0_g1_i3.p1  ORF type:complete len:363 (+),score=52.19 TRINITY_DN3580_c0_g1_i3:79-1167(+)